MNKKVCILFGSPRKNGNTSSLLIPFMDELNKAGADVKKIDLYDKKIEGCLACRTCQDIGTSSVALLMMICRKYLIQ